MCGWRIQLGMRADMVDNRKTKIGCMAYGKIEGKNTPDKCCQMAEAIWGGGGGGDGGG